ncbi:MAG: amidohydrolase family protein [Spirochaetales bacterium]|nr:amidohydrolase family protein [Spirochaetales bacterium]
MKKIITGKFVIVSTDDIRRDHAVVIADDCVESVIPEIEAKALYPEAEVIRCDDCVISPGFINGHMHLYGVLSHGITPPVPVKDFEDFLHRFWWPLVENRLDPKMIEAASRYAVCELVSSGVTSLCDILEAPEAGAAGLEREIEVLREIGIRGVISTEACERISSAKGYDNLRDNILIAELLKNDPLLDAWQCIHTTFTCSDSFIRNAFGKYRGNDHKPWSAETLQDKPHNKSKRIQQEKLQDSGRLGLSADGAIPIQLHLNESRYEPERCMKERGMRSAEWYEHLGVLGPHLLASQCVHLSDREIELLSHFGVRAVHLPLSNCEVGGVVARIPEMLKAGIPCGLGTDGYINDFFQVMRAAFLFHKGHREDPETMPAKTVWDMATRGGGAAIYPGKKIGVLTPGAAADLIAVSLRTLPTPVNEQNLFDQLILYCSPKDVTTVCAAGRLLKRDGRIDMHENRTLESIRWELQQETERLWTMKA